MNRASVLLISVLLTLMVTGCVVKQPQQQLFPSQLPLQSLAGVVIQRQQQLWFQPCYEKRWWPIEDFTPQQELSEHYQRFTGFSKSDLYVELQAVVDPAFDKRLLVKQLDTVGGTAATCHFRLAGVLFRAASSDPHWVADILTDRVIVKSVKPLASFQFQTRAQTLTVDETVSSDELGAAASQGKDFAVIARYTEKIVKQGKQPFEITLIKQRCVDSESGALLPLTAQMMFYDRAYHGCARRGHTQTDEIAGFYWYQPEDGHQVMFKLSTDYQVQLVSRDASGKAMTEHGHWQYLKSGKLIFSMQDAEQHEYLMLFRRGTGGQLVLQTGADHWVEYGATFKLWRPSGLQGGVLLPRDKPEQDSKRDAPLVAEPASVTSLTAPSIQAADMDDELLNEIIIDEIQQP
ncbi:hypothetical protein Q4488_02285 [Amphritea sp. 1_MG-2023]|uniref:hypothetical protein n=1 Tax=Amphritea sp. 1_MG-2023 TaxID=3062670 RepID=UPI0026E424E5|nr:hypothetical protein [Amphritea sp. 1_MG-2023]MDO6562200.1 hypothetical protein [Amphritea sp. 1_MG-2023]